MKRRNIFYPALLAAGLAVPGVAAAAVVTGTLTVSLEVLAGCTSVGNEALAFGPQGTQITTAATQEVELKVTCSTGSPYTVGLDFGQFAQGSVRRMKSASGAFIEYEIYHDSSKQQAWDDNGLGRRADTGIDSPQPFKVYGRVLPNQTVAPGKYVDTVKIAVSY